VREAARDGTWCSPNAAPRLAQQSLEGLFGDAGGGRGGHVQIVAEVARLRSGRIGADRDTRQPDPIAS
jgi:hypothetical protein